MKKTFLSSAIAAVMFATSFAWTCFTGSQASAQPAISAPMAPAMASSPGSQGPSLCPRRRQLHLLKQSVRLKAGLKDLQADAERVQKGFEQQLQELQHAAERLKDLKPGTPDYTSLEESLVSQKAIIQGQVQLKRKEFVQREAQLYYNEYQTIQNEVAYYCQEHRISVVLNFDHEKVRDDSPDVIAHGIGKPVVYHDNNLDITPYILPRFMAPIADNRGAVGFPQH